MIAPFTGGSVHFTAPDDSSKPYTVPFVLDMIAVFAAKTGPPAKAAERPFALFGSGVFHNGSPVAASSAMIPPIFGDVNVVYPAATARPCVLG